MSSSSDNAICATTNPLRKANFLLPVLNLSVSPLSIGSRLGFVAFSAGAIAGQIFGHKTKSTVIGAATGAAAGAVVAGEQQDSADARLPDRPNGLGGAIYNQGTASVSDSTVSRNAARGTAFSSGYGGGIHNAGSLSVNASTLMNNDASEGDGIENFGYRADGTYSTGATLTISASTVSGNYGDGIFNRATLTANGCTLSGNEGAGTGNFGDATVAGCTLSGNAVGFDNAGRATINDCMVSGNYSSGIYNANYLAANLTVTGGTITGTGAASRPRRPRRGGRSCPRSPIPTASSR